MNNFFILVSILLCFLIGCSLNIQETKYPSGKIKERISIIKEKDGSVLWNGRYTIWYENGKLMANGFFVKRNPKDTSVGSTGIPMSNRNGKWCFWYENGQKQSEEYYLNGLLNGKYQTWYENGNIQSLEEYLNGQRSGHFISFYQNGKKEKDQILNDTSVFNGKCLSWYENGQIKTEGVYANGHIQGTYLEYYQNGNKKREEVWKDSIIKDSINSLCTLWNENGFIERIAEFKNGIMEGIDKQFFPDGKIGLDCYVLNHKWNGPVKFYLHNGDIGVDIVCSNGKIIKVNKYSLECGTSLLDAISAGFVDSADANNLIFQYNTNTAMGCGKREMYQTFYKNGQIKERYSTKKDSQGHYLKDGLYTMFHENGQKWTIGSYKDGKGDGHFTSWYENGQKQQEATYKDDKAEGLCDIWYVNGQKKQETIYKDGQVISETLWYENGQKQDDAKTTEGDAQLLLSIIDKHDEDIGMFEACAEAGLDSMRCEKANKIVDIILLKRHGLIK